MIEIKNRFTGKIIFKSKRKTLKEVIELKVKQGAYLGGAYLEGAYLGGADLGGAYLRGAYLGGAYLRGAYLEGAYLRGADLGGADLGGAYLEGAYLGGADLGGADLGGADLGGAYLRGADLRVKHPPVNSHQFISEVLSRNSETEAQWDFSARIRLQTDQCWGFFIKLARKKRVLKWAKEILFQWDEFKEKLEDKLDG